MWVLLSKPMSDRIRKFECEQRRSSYGELISSSLLTEMWQWDEDVTEVSLADDAVGAGDRRAQAAGPGLRRAGQRSA